MNTDTKTIAKFLATAIWADDEFSSVERDFLSEAEHHLELENLVVEVDAIIPEFSTMSAEELMHTLTVAAEEVDEDEKDGLLALCLQTMGADSNLAQEELVNYFVLANILEINETRAKVIMAEFVDIVDEDD